MASYTMELREYIEMWSQDEEISIRDRIEKGRTKLFNFEYPIFDPDYKKVFETHFIRRFYMREIGYETEELFKFYLENYLLINMSYWNKMFESELFVFDPLTNTKVDVTQNKTNDKTQTSTSTTDGTSNSTQDGTNNQTSNSTVNQTNDETVNQTGNQTSSGTESNDDFNRSIKSDTPDTRLNLTATDGEGLLEYASEIQENNANKSKTSSGLSDTTGETIGHQTNETIGEKTNNQTTHATGEDVTNVTSTGNGTINEIEDYVENRFGKVGTQTFSSMVNEYRSSLLRLENQIFSEMEKELFMLVY